jgi:RNA polymerase sigma factor (sigma-70 family)
MRSSDHQLVRRLKANDRGAFEEVVERHYQPVYRHLWHLCGDSDVASDLTQETFLRAWQSLPTFEGRSALGTWLFAIAGRVWSRWLHGRSGPAPLPLDEMAEAVTDEALGPAAQFERRAVQDEVQDALRRLPADYREALVLFYVQGLKYREIAEVLGIPLGTVKSRLHGGVLRLRAALEGRGTDQPYACLSPNA